MSTISINTKIQFSELLEIIKNLPLKEKMKIKEVISESSSDDIPDWQKRIVMERSEEYLKNPGIAVDFDKVIKEIEDGL